MGWRRHSTTVLILCWLMCGCALVIIASPAARAATPETTIAPNGPFFTALGVVQAATQTAGTLAPNTIATIYGMNLSWTTHAVTAADLNGGTLPTSLDGVTVYVGGISSNLLYVSPGQINFLIPYELTGPTAQVLVARQGIAGPYGTDGLPAVKIPMATTAPGFFQWNGNFAVAEHADGSLITATAPAQAGEIVVLFAAGLGRTVPDSTSGRVPSGAATILYASQMQILLNSVPLPAASTYYAGVTPGFAGLYQINLRLPNVLPANPEIQIVFGAQGGSPATVLLYAN
jgi:uncharacterized protein (TIGR03437 family)